jgi:hypothetical protein
MALEYSEFDKFYEKMTKAFGKLETGQFLTNFMRKEGLKAVRYARERTPVRTGNLRRNWNIDGPISAGSDTNVIIVNPVEYAEYIERGHTVRSKSAESRYEGWHMAEIAAMRVRNEMPRDFDREFKSFMKKNGF